VPSRAQYRWGNLTNETGITGKTNHEGLNTSASPLNQLAGFGYDPAGNMTGNGGITYVYDAENRLVWTTGGYRYIYDGDGNRVEKCVAGSAITACPTSGTNGTLYWMGGSSAALDESDLSGNMLEQYVFFGGARVARRDVSPSAVHYYFSDQVGSHSVVANAAGTACEQDIDYYPYGGQENDYCPNVAQHYKFNGKERDNESGLDYFIARHYASSLGRFMSVDPVTITPERKMDPQQLNRYAYVRNSPLRLTDPTGEDIDCYNSLGRCFEVLKEIAGSAADRLSMNTQTGKVTFNTDGLDLSSNEGAALINQLVTSSDTYGFSLGDTVNTEGGPVKVGSDPVNLDRQYDDRYGNGKAATDRPPKGIADQVAINPALARFKDSQGRSVLLSSLAFHELAEAYAKIDGGKAYGDFLNINLVNGTTLVISPVAQQGAHNEAAQREEKLRGQRPNLQSSGRAGDQLLRDPHN
jgi:RHS repeat-associated protein